jgi:hypothetical protein
VAGTAVTARLFTAGWSALHEAAKRGPLPVQPVRISKGKPKFWPAAEGFPAVDVLMPDGWMLSSLVERGKVERGYFGKLNRIGLDVIAARLDEIAEQVAKPLALCCFEPRREDCHRSWAADWLAEQTGHAVPELGTLTAKHCEPGQERRAVLCHEVARTSRYDTLMATNQAPRR